MSIQLKQLPKSTTLASALFLFRENEILVGEHLRGPMLGKIGIPGGKIQQATEIVAAGTCRETREEVGIEVQEKDIVYSALVYFYWQGKAEGHPVFTCAVFTTNVWAGEPRVTASMRPFWVSKSALPYEDMMPGDRAWIPLLFNGEKFIGHVFYNSNGSELVDFKYTPVQVLPELDK